jgi:hypothetical protein
MNLLAKTYRLTRTKVLTIVDQIGVGGDAGYTLGGAVGQGGGNGEPTLTADSHTEKTNFPALDNLSLSKIEGSARVARGFGVEDYSVLQLSDVTYPELPSLLGPVSSSDLYVRDGDAANDLCFNRDFGLCLRTDAVPTRVALTTMHRILRPPGPLAPLRLSWTVVSKWQAFNAQYFSPRASATRFRPLS